MRSSLASSAGIETKSAGVMKDESLAPRRAGDGRAGIPRSEVACVGFASFSDFGAPRIPGVAVLVGSLPTARRASQPCCYVHTIMIPVGTYLYGTAVITP